MKLIIVSGLSGAGKTIALHSLEDMGVYCVDNLPVCLLPAFIEHVPQLGQLHDCVAVGVDARSASTHEMPKLLDTLMQLTLPLEILFLESEDAVLIKRFSETRRKHPLTTDQLPLAEAIRHERALLAPLATRADIRINTSQMHVHQLRDMIRARVGLQPSEQLSLLFQSFGFKYGVPSDVDFVFDVRCLPNPYWQMELRHQTGQESDVQQFLQSQPQVQQMLSSIRDFLEQWLPAFIADNRSYLTIAIGCTGGRHRSVYIAEQLALHFKTNRRGVLLRHRELS
ncbi:RNase adapter RapZ [Thioflexithrix psekupsensis]|uniref:RNase adaptor protein RapZ n=1 Tax=Thioflexithrix psekupsensis TaxID=1570016 RepID=A0A251X8P6_9GAMM|nr:RNase adapter RapZ [Thioflexithrix psekupsensis]OUD14305.1 RNase adaptor protein RapZ [Thioflexithrix psekupsensis]